MENTHDRGNRNSAATDIRKLIRNLARSVVPLFCLAGIPLLSNGATLHHDPNTGYVTSITGLNVNGTLYNATFHLGVPFEDIWNWELGPWEFGGNREGAEAAGNAIATALGSSERTHELGDSFHIPISTGISAAFSDLEGVQDLNNELDVDLIGEGGYTVLHRDQPGWYPEQPLVSFAVVPIPPAVWLFGSGLLGVVGIARRKRAA
jgi:hypothetical protein